jgi:trimethylamine--corrinoid protein Co-methyltransferase
LVVWDEESCRKVHEATLLILESVGVQVRNYPPALELFAAAGARVDGNRVRIEPQVVEKALASAPRSWLVHSRGRAETLDLKDGNSYFGPGSDCLYIRDPDTHERRRIAHADIEGLGRAVREAAEPRLHDVHGATRRCSAARR